MSIKRNSIGYQLFDFGKSVFQDEPKDICQYMRGIIKGLLLAVLLVVAGVGIGMGIIEPIAVGIGYLFTGEIIPFYGLVLVSNPKDQFVLAGVGMSVWIFVGTLIMFGMGNHYVWKPIKYRMKMENRESTLAMSWKSVKEKTCLMIDFEGEKSEVFKR